MGHRGRSAALLAAVTCIAIPLLLGCTYTLGVKGELLSGQESFRGQTHGSLVGFFAQNGPRAGMLGESFSLVTSKGVNCTGLVAYDSATKGHGELRCEDGRTGPFEFILVDQEALATGTLAGEAITFRIGN
jgi:hypothetical protein